MYVTRPLSWLRRSRENLSLTPSEGPNSGYLVLYDEESESACCFGLCKRKSIANLPFPQNKDIRVFYSSLDVLYVNDVLFVPVLDQPLSSNLYYVIRRQGKHEGQACANSKEEDKASLCCFSCTPDAEPRPLDPSDTYQQFEIVRRKYIETFYAKSVPPNGSPPNFLRHRDWAARISKTQHYQLSEAPGVNSPLRAGLPEFNFSLFSASSKPVVVGKWYCPFMFVNDNDMSPKEQIRRSTFYEVTLEQRWDKIFGLDNVGSDAKEVSIDVEVQREEVFVSGVRGVRDSRSAKDGTVIWFRSRDDAERVGLSVKVVERMLWEQEQAGFSGGEARVVRHEEFRGRGKWTKFGCYVLVERFVVKRIDGTPVLAHDFRHVHRIRTKWE